MKDDALTSSPTTEELVEFVSGKLSTVRANEIQAQAMIDTGLRASIEDLQGIARLCFGTTIEHNELRKQHFGR